MPKKLPEEQARQGRLGLPVLVVLAAALILAAVEQPDLTGFFGAVVQRGLHGMKAANQ